MKACETIENIAMIDNFGIAHEGHVYTQFSTGALGSGAGPASAVASRGIGGLRPPTPMLKHAEAAPDTA